MRTARKISAGRLAELKRKMNNEVYLGAAIGKIASVLTDQIVGGDERECRITTEMISQRWRDGAREGE